MAKSSIHFEKTDASFAKKHNSRAEEPTYLLPKKFWQGNTFEEIYSSKKVDVLYKWQCRTRKRLHRRGSTPTLKDSMTEAVINLNSGHTLNDVKKVAEWLNSEYGFTPVSYAIHRDEGHLEKRNGKLFPVYNYHAHVVFFTMKDGLNKRRTLGAKELEKINTETARLLNMERGISKSERWENVAKKLGVGIDELKRHKDESAVEYKERIRVLAEGRGLNDFDIYKETKARKRLSAKQYREVAERMEQQIVLSEKEVNELEKKLNLDQEKIEKLTDENTVLSNDKESLEKLKDNLEQQISKLNTDQALRQKDVSAICETVRKAFKGQGLPKEFFRELGAIKKSDIKEVNELHQALTALLMKYDCEIKSKDKTITGLTDSNTVLSNSILEQNLAQTNLITYTTLEEAYNYDRYNLETHYGFEQVFNFEKYKAVRASHEQSMQGLSERSMVHKGKSVDMSVYGSEISQLRDRERNGYADQHSLLRSVYAETVIYSVDPRTRRVLTCEDQNRYNNIYGIASLYDRTLKTLAQTIDVTYTTRKQFIENIQQKVSDLKDTNAVLANQQPKEIIKTVEVVKEAPRALTSAEIEALPRVKQLQQENQNLIEYYENLLKPDMSNLTFSFLTVEDLQELKPKVLKKTHFGLMETVETPQDVINRFNKVLQRRNEDVNLNYRKMKRGYETVTEENKEVKAENLRQKGIIDLFYKLSENVGLFFDKNSTLEHITKTVMNFGSRLFGAFINDNKKDKDFVWNSICEGQEFKLQQIEKKQKQEQQAKIEKQVDQALGFGNSKPQVHDRGGRGM